ncbi:MAG TPA: nucleoside hydrolase [Chloroflexi bacterium]|jgi:purine nucleosidase|nr:nucleoside hydrolase [Chloroflexota bacterium]
MTTFPPVPAEKRVALLEPPRGPVSMVLDTDTYNEIDDQFALVYSLLSPNLTLEAVYAAPFFNSRSTGPADGMEKSYEEIIRILELMGHPTEGFALCGSDRYLPSRDEPVPSPAVDDLIARARARRNGPLYVLAIGAITNVASALLTAPDIIDRIVVVWLGGHPTYWPTAREFNLQQDVPAAQVVFDSGVPLVHVPCKNVAEHLRTTLPEMEAYVKGAGPIGDYLYGIFHDYHDDHYAWSKVIWDISTVAYLNDPDRVPTRLVPSPILRDDVTWAPEDPTRHVVRMATDVNRDAVFGDLFRKLQARTW